MTINLYYVEGISRIDTPSFNTKTHYGTINDQKEFFLTKLVKTIDGSYYPPHYENLIKFDKEDLEITDNVNYLSLEYNGKFYYYFIDDIDYTSTGIISLHVSMDVIQTYMFDIYISSGIIERKFINRWITTGSSDYINREYKRENVSGGNFVYNSQHVINNEQNNWFIVTKYAKGSLLTDPLVYSKCGLKNEDIFYPSSITFAPFKNLRTIVYNDNAYNCNSAFYVRFVSIQPEVCECYIIPFSPFKDSDVNPTSGYVNSASLNVDIQNDMVYGIGPRYNMINGVKIGRIDSDIKKYTHSFNFVRNSLIGISYNSKYMPVMLDENYILFIFGSRSSNTSVSLFKYDITSITCCYFANILDGSRFYYISSGDASSYKQDNYRTLVADYAPINMDLISDKWAQFNATNRYRWLATSGQVAINGIKLFITAGMSSAFASADIAKIATSSLTPKRQKISKKGQRAIEAIQRRQRDEIPDNIVQGINSSLPILSSATTEMNMIHAPDTIKQASSFDDISSSSYSIICEIQKVNDYEQCAQYYHRNGYLVNEYVTQVSNIFNSVKNRYYFDMLKMSVPEVHLHNVIEDDDTVGLIEERLETGLRLWNIKNSDVIIGDFTYDNVENDFLS